MITLTQAQLVSMNKKVIGRIVYTEGQYGAQCVGWFKWLCGQLGVPVYATGTNYAAGYWTKDRDAHYGPYFEFITGASNFRDGDIVIWPYGSTSCPFSHIAMKIGNSCLSQNQNGKPYVTLGECNSWNEAHGAFRYKGLVKTKPAKDILTIAKEVVQGLWGNGAQRKQALTAAGYDYVAVQAVVNQLVSGSNVTKNTKQVANEVIAGKWGNGQDRYNRLVAAGYDYNEVQGMVNAILNQQNASSSGSLHVGSKILIKAGARDLNTGGTYLAFVYNRVHTVTEISGNRVVFAYNGTIVGAVAKGNCIVQ